MRLRPATTWSKRHKKDVATQKTWIQERQTFRELIQNYKGFQEKEKK